MHVLVVYDISDNRLRGKIFAFLKEKGLHSQKSVFECDMDPATLRSALRFLRRQELGDRDSIVLYPLCARCARKGRILGQGLRLERTDWIII